MSDFYIHRDGFIYHGDFTEGAREATNEEISAHLGTSIAARKQDVRSAINSERDRREQGGFEYLGKVFDSDPTSVIRINAAVNTAVSAVLSGSDFSVDWTCADNSTVALNAQQFMGLATALAEHSNTQHIRARGMKDQLDAAETEEDLAAVENLLNEWKNEA
jgi:hypothetical protein